MGLSVGNGFEGLEATSFGPQEDGSDGGRSGCSDASSVVSLSGGVKEEEMDDLCLALAVDTVTFSNSTGAVSMSLSAVSDSTLLSTGK